MNLHRWRPHTGGFTLVELLVVIAIVTLLAALLLPALSVARAKSQSIYCVNSAKQMGIASAMYVGDNADSFPWTFTFTGDELLRLSWFNYLTPYQESQRLWLCPVRPKTLPLAPIRPAGFFQRSADGEIIFPSDGKVVNYAFNVELGGYFYQGQPSVLPRQASAVPAKASETILICDSGSQVVNTTDPKLCVTPQSPPKHGAWILADPSSTRIADSFKATTDDPNWCGPQLRHLEKANVVFLDTHVESIASGSGKYYAGSRFLRASGN